MIDERLRHRAYTRQHGDDPPELSGWTWPGHGKDPTSGPIAGGDWSAGGGPPATVA
jgi:hypothetical protein